MKKGSEDAYCPNPNCEWTGDAVGLTDCPLCGTPLAMFDALDEDDPDAFKEDKYPVDYLSQNNPEEDFPI